MKGRATPIKRKSSGMPLPPAAPPELPEVLQQLLDLARFGNYFQCLGVPADVSTTEVREAWQRRAAELDAARPLAAMSGEIAAALADLAQVMEDAFEVLADPDRRLAYRRALTL